MMMMVMMMVVMMMVMVMITMMMMMVVMMVMMIHVNLTPLGTKIWFQNTTHTVARCDT